MIKIDLHMHTGEDPYDGLRYPATALIDRAVALDFGAIAITLHEKVLEDPRIFRYAEERGLLLIPAVEWSIDRSDVLLYNVTQQEAETVQSFADLKKLKETRGDELLIVAPHPFYPVGHSLRHHLEPQIELFEAIEYSQVHLPWLNYNKHAENVARAYGKPIVANSDSHNLWMFGNHYTLVDAPREMTAIFQAIRQNRVEWHSPPLSVLTCFRMFFLDPIQRKPGQTVNSFE